MFNQDLKKQRVAENFSFYDFSSILLNCFETGNNYLGEIIEQIAENYPELQESLDHLENEEFMLYLHDIYGIYFDEKISYYMVGQRNSFERKNHKGNENTLKVK